MHGVSNHAITSLQVSDTASFQFTLVSHTSSVCGCTALHGVSNHQPASFPYVRFPTGFSHFRYVWVYRVAWCEQSSDCRFPTRPVWVGVPCFMVRAITSLQVSHTSGFTLVFHTSSMGGCTSLHGVSNHHIASFPYVRFHTGVPHVQYGWVYRVAWCEQPSYSMFPIRQVLHRFPTRPVWVGVRVAWCEQPSYSMFPIRQVLYRWVYALHGVSNRQTTTCFLNVRFYTGFPHVLYGWVYRVAWCEQPSDCRFPKRQVSHRFSIRMGGCTALHGVSNRQTAAGFPHVLYGWVYRVAWCKQP